MKEESAPRTMKDEVMMESVRLFSVLYDTTAVRSKMVMRSEEMGCMARSNETGRGWMGRVGVVIQVVPVASSEVEEWIMEQHAHISRFAFLSACACLRVDC